MWYDVKEYEKYLEIKIDGTIRSKPRWLKYERCGKKRQEWYKGKILKPHKDKDGYLRISIKINNKSINLIVHRLLLQTFVSNPLNKPQVNHKNGIKDDNRIENLEWVTNKENQYHAKINGLIHTPKIPNELVQKIKDKYSTGKYTQRDLAKEYDTQHSNIWWVLNKR
jgi:hypothetical protein